MSKLNVLYKHSPRVLLVEDNLLSQKVTKLVLESLGCVVDVAATGQAALDMFSDQHTMVFMDLGLPDIDGAVITKKIRHANKEVPIVVVTAHVLNKDRAISYNPGFSDIMMKPLSLSSVQDALLRFMPQQPEAV